ncbi:MAG: hypothetical protein JSV10_10835 [Candidatus Zixiibacteriota bacterium]|nr:MAG: hypothetical protein JSV10_10835 [candidate division Zixibacteria bacterium]
MHSGRKSWIALAGILLLLPGATALADQGPDDIQCLPEGHSLIEVQGDESVSDRRYTVPRKQVLMEEATATW